MLPSTAWHPEFEDVNNDGFPDLFVTKGNVEAQVDYATRDPNNLLLGQADGTFVDRAEAAGIVGFERGRGAALVDLNLDGMLDLVVVNRRENVKLWRNVGAGDAEQPAPMGHWTALRLRQPAPNTDAVGAWVEVRAGDGTVVREVTVGGGHGGGKARLAPRRPGRGGRRSGPRPVARRRDRAVGGGARRRVRDDRAGRGRGQPVAAGGLGAMAKTTTARARLAEVTLPDFGMPAAEPRLPPSIYADRMERLRSAMDARGYEHLVVWADREHSANIAYLTGFDPRFEEAVLIVGSAGDPAVLVGNECHGMAGAAPLPMRRVRFQDLSLPGQPRGESAPLPEIMSDEGIGPGSKVGVIGWKTYARRDAIEAPAFLVDQLRQISGTTGLVENATDLLIDASDGLRVTNEVEQLAAFEWAACQTSHGLKRVLTGLQPGVTEREAARMLEWNGAPLSCHLMLTAGPRASFGLLSPGDRPIERGDPFTIAFGIWGALELPGRVRRRGRVGAARRHRGLRRAPGRAVLRGGRGVVRGPARRPAGRRAAGHRRPPSG